MKKLFSSLIVLALLLYCSSSFAAVGISTGGGQLGVASVLNLGCDSNSTITSDGFTYNTACNPNFVIAGISNGGSTSMTTAQLAVPVTYSLVKKAIAASANPGFTAGTLANGVPGQIETILITAVGSGGTWVLTPATATGWTNVTFNTYSQSAPQFVTLLYVNNTTGWIVLNYGGSTLPTFTDVAGQ